MPQASDSDRPALPPRNDSREPSIPRPAIIALVVLLFTAFVMLVNETTLAIALPWMMDDFGITAAVAQWFLTGFMLTMAVILPATGWVIERFSTRAVFAFASTAFLIGTVIAAIAPDFTAVLIGRIAQAIGTALVMPLLMTVAMNVVPAGRRGVVMGLISVVMAVAPAIGPSFAGIILNFTTWHGIFWVLVPAVAVAAIIGLIWLPNIGERRRAPFDIVSLLLAVVAFGGLVYALSSMSVIAEGGDSALIVFLILGAGAIALSLFVWRQLARGRRGVALLDLGPLRERNFTISMTVIVLLFGSMLGVFSVFPLVLQGSLLLTALIAGLAMLPGGLLEGLLAPIAGRFFDVHGPRPLVIIGATLVFASYLWMGTISHSTPLPVVIGMYVLACMGFAMTFTPLIATALGSLPARQYAHGSAILNTLQQLAGAAGTALLIGVYSAVSIDAMTGGTNEPAALGEGGRLAFVVGAIIALVALVLSAFITRIPVRSESVPDPGVE